MALTGTYFPLPAASDLICSPPLTSHNRTVPSLADDKILRPRAMIAVDVIALVCARSVRIGERLVEDVSEGSAGRIVRVKSAPPVRRTLDEGKNLKEVTELRWTLECFWRSTECEVFG